MAGVGLEAAHTSGLTTALMLAHVEACGGSRAVGAVLERIGRPHDEGRLRDERTWCSWRTKIALFEAAAEVLDDPEVTYTAGRLALERGVAGPLKTALRALGTPGVVYANVARANHKFSSVSRMVLEEMAGHRARLRYELVEDGLEPSRLDCLYNQGLLACVPVMFDLPPARIDHPVCATRGGDACVYEVSWAPQVRPGWRITTASGLSAAAAVGGTAALAPDMVAATAAAMGASLAWWMGRRREQLAQSVARLQRDLQLHAERSERVRSSLHALSSALKHDEVVTRVTEHASQALGGIDCVLLLDEGGERTVRASTGIGVDAARQLERWAARIDLQTPFTVEDSSLVPELAGVPDIGTLCAAPLLSHGQPVGVLIALSQRAYSFLPRELSVLELFAEQAAIALVNARLYAAQKEMASRDPLTGLRNHREFHEVLGGELARANRSAARFSVVLMDLDGFKAVNDRFGHAAGDRLLAEIGAALDTVGRAGDRAFRIGGDEFAVILPEATPADADTAAARIAAAVTGIDARVGISWGVATWPEDGSAKEVLLARADERLYAMKRERDGEHAAAHVEETLVSALAALGEALEAKDAYTAEHAREVADIVDAVARRMRLDAPALRTVGHAALLHDVGKIAVPIEILNKPGRLTDEEFEIVKSHSAIGGSMVSRIPGLEGAAPLVRSAHERWDGRGYPDGLAGEDIPLGARIIAACDAFHAMTSDRPYRRALDIGTAAGELRSHSGTQFDPEVVAALLAELGVPLAAGGETAPVAA